MIFRSIIKTHKAIDIALSQVNLESIVIYLGWNHLWLAWPKKKKKKKKKLAWLCKSWEPRCDIRYSEFPPITCMLLYTSLVTKLVLLIYPVSMLVRDEGQLSRFSVVRVISVCFCVFQFRALLIALKSLCQMNLSNSF